jgi:spore coat protein U domain-containing protein, fimbrial subunit CupE1/2/3/6
MRYPRGWCLATLVAIAVGVADGHAQLLRGQLRSPDKGCSIGATPVAFGSYDTLNPMPADSQGTVSYSCGTHTERTPIKNVQIEMSSGSSGTYDRAMSGGADRLRYNVFTDAARQTIWGDGSGGTGVVRHSDPQNHQTYTVPVFGRIVAQQDVLPGAYSDTLIVTIEW